MNTLQQRVYSFIAQKITELEKLEDAKKEILDFSDFQANIFLNIEFSDSDTAEDYIEMLDILSMFEENHYGHVIARIEDAALKKILIIKAIARMSEQLRDLFKILEDTKLSEAQVREIENLPDNNTSKIDVLKDEKIKFSFENLKKVLQLTLNQAAAFCKLPQEEQTLANMAEIAKLTHNQALVLISLPEQERTIVNIAEIVKLTHNQAVVLISLPEQERTIVNIAKIPKLTDNQADAFYNLPKAERILDNIARISKLTHYQATNFNYLPKAEKTLVHLESIAKMKAFYSIELFFLNHNSQITMNELHIIHKQMVCSDVFIQASFNSAIKQILPEDSQLTKFIAPAVAQFITYNTGSFLLPAALDILRFGGPQIILQTTEFALKFYMPLVTHKLLQYVHIPVSPLIMHTTLKAISVLSAFYSYSHEQDTGNSFYEIITNIAQDNSDPISIGFLAFSATHAIPGVSLLAAIGIAGAAGAASYAVSELLLGENSNEVNLETADL